MFSELIEKVQEFFDLVEQNLGPKRTAALIEQARLRPIELQMLRGFKPLLTDEDRQNYEDWLTSFEQTTSNGESGEMV